MIKLTLEGDDFKIYFASNHELFEKTDSRLFFTSILGFEYIDSDDAYLAEGVGDIVQMISLVRNSIRKLDDMKIDYSTDIKVQRLLEAADESDKQLSSSTEKWISIIESDDLRIDVPDFTRALKPYQIRGVMHGIDVNHPANFSVPGSGKTTMTYAIYSVLRSKGLLDKLVVIGPGSSFMSWEDEFEACFGKKVTSLRVRGDIVREMEDSFKKSDLMLLTYQMASRITPELIRLLSNSKVLLVLDESHNIKRFNGGLWSSSVLKLAPYATKRMILTGTPMPNNLYDLWSQFTFLWPFKNLLKNSGQYKSMVKSTKGNNRIKDMIKPFYYRVTKSDLGLPPPRFDVIKVPLGQVQKRIYEAIAAKTLVELNSAPTERERLRQWRKNKIIRLLQVASNPTLLTKFSDEFRIPPLNAENLETSSLIQNYPDYEIPSKMIEAVRLTQELLNSGEKVLIWTTFIHNIDMLKKMLEDERPLIIYGDVPRDEHEDQLYNRELIIKEFKGDSKPRVLIANPSSLAESVSLQRICKHAIYLDRTFNAGQYIQSMDRIHRIGLQLDETVYYHILQGTGTIDEAIDIRLNDKISRLFSLLDDQLPALSFDTSISEVSDISDQEFEKDFLAVTQHLIKLSNRDKVDVQS